MATNKLLYENVKEIAFERGIVKPCLSDYKYITDNLKYPLFKWQEEALLNFLTNEIIREQGGVSLQANHLLFNMATGSGKTLVMAALILYYYKKGYRHFLFFVNQKNIVGKTEDNFTNPYHSKYLFTNTIVIDKKQVEIEQVVNFSDANDNIQIKFTTIHQLHNDVYQVRENNTTLEDLQRRSLVLLGDEAHHLNSETKKKKCEQLEFLKMKELSGNSRIADVERSWEHTVVNLILNRKNASCFTECSKPNVLLEFTATIKQAGKNVIEKYRDKIIYKFDLAAFRNAGYTKEVNLVSSSLSRKERVLQSLLFNWYRQYIATQNKIRLKPVILFRSKTISDSRIDFNKFRVLIDSLTTSDFDFLNRLQTADVSQKNLFEQGQARLEAVKNLVNSNVVSLKTIVEEIKHYFIKENCIITNSLDNQAKSKEKTTEAVDNLLNNLEDRNNPIRAIFTVRRLTEGWDVQNLYDIVRLYETRDAGRGRAGNSTISEVQLLGRGVRYYPFKFGDAIPNKRKFDGNLTHELRILEELFFHSNDDINYISELKKELKRQELLNDNHIVKEFDLKEDFKAHPFFNKINIWYNKQTKNKSRQKRDLIDIKSKISPTLIKLTGSNFKIEQIVFRHNQKDKVLEETVDLDEYTLSFRLGEFDRPIIEKAINKVAQREDSLYRFKNLKHELNIKSLKQLYTEDKYLADCEVIIILDAKDVQKLRRKYGIVNDKEILRYLPRNKMLEALVGLFEGFEVEWKKNIYTKVGSDFKYSKRLTQIFDRPKKKSIDIATLDTTLEQALVSKDWYILDGFHGTSEEVELAIFLESIIGNFRTKYDEVFLLRNEEVYKIYNFVDGVGFQPDFLLFLNNKDTNICYQVFIEPKGNHLLQIDSWKEAFLQEITNRYGEQNILHEQGKKYRLVGLPFYNKKLEYNFKKSVNDYLEINI